MATNLPHTHGGYSTAVVAGAALPHFAAMRERARIEDLEKEKARQNWQKEIERSNERRKREEKASIARAPALHQAMMRQMREENMRWSKQRKEEAKRKEKEWLYPSRETIAKRKEKRRQERAALLSKKPKKNGCCVIC